MNLITKLCKFLNSTAGILILVICWVAVSFILFTLTNLDDTEIRFKKLFIPNPNQESVYKFTFTNSHQELIADEDREELKTRNYSIENSILPKTRNNQPEMPQVDDFEERSKKEITYHNNVTTVHLYKKTYKKINVLSSTIIDKNEKISSSESDNVTLENKHQKVVKESKILDNNDITIESNNEWKTIYPMLNNSNAPENEHPEVVKESKILDSNDITIELNNEWKTIYPMLNNSNAPGEMGRPFEFDKSKFSISEKEEYESGWKKHQFNLFASDRISVRRTIPDLREKSCKSENISSNLPTSSIVIVFHNEAWSTLLRTVHSIIDRSPKSLIKEIILVDDGSTFEHLKSPLESYMKLLEIVKIKRTESRVGLMKARIFGAEGTLGNVLTFLDAHIECYPGWLEPLLSRIAENNKTVVCPVIDSINDETFQNLFVSSSGISAGVFDWTMQFGWEFPSDININRVSDKSPITTPAMAGGLFSINRKYFYELGTYDPGMKIWGSENVEMSLRVWMCGGQLEILPCSRVGHVFRRVSPYSWGESIDKILTINLKRLVDVWLDEYKDFYYAFNGNRNNYDSGEVSDRLKLRRKLKCHSFSWYLNNIFPSLFNPRNSQFIGSIESFSIKDICFDLVNEKSQYMKLYPCHNSGGNQLWIFDENGYLRTINKCLNYKLEFYKCKYSKAKYGWKYDKQNFFIVDENKNCITGDGKEIYSKKCSFQSPNINQKWNLKSFMKFQSSNENDIS